MMLDELSVHLKPHDIDATTEFLNPGTFDVQTTLQNQLADRAADILILGGYGTPSIRQKIFGGVTSTILKSMITPILMSH